MTDQALSKRSAQWWLLYVIMLAGDTFFAARPAHKLNALLGPGWASSPFNCVRKYIRDMNLESALRGVDARERGRVARAFRHITNSDLFPSDPRQCSLERLHEVPGLEPKAAVQYWRLLHPGVAWTHQELATDEECLTWV